MIKQAVAATITLLALAAFNAPTADAQNTGAMNSQGVTGTFGNTSKTTRNFRLPNAGFTGSQRRPGVKKAGLGGLSEIHGQTGRNGLPNTTLDSFVLNAGGSAEHIYGDEGADGIPPYFEFTQAHRINTGITGPRDQGLTTGHGSYMPDAWGGDEFVDGPEFSMSGSNGGNPQYWSQGVYYGADPGTPMTSDPNPIDPNAQPPDSTSINNQAADDPYSAGEYRSDQGPTAPGTTGDGAYGD